MISLTSPDTTDSTMQVKCTHPHRDCTRLMNELNALVKTVCPVPCLCRVKPGVWVYCNCRSSYTTGFVFFLLPAQVSKSRLVNDFVQPSEKKSFRVTLIYISGQPSRCSYSMLNVKYPGNIEIMVILNNVRYDLYYRERSATFLLLLMS